MEHKYKALFKLKGVGAQMNRRKCLLDKQEKERQTLLDGHRQILEHFTVLVNKQPKKTKLSHLPSLLMLSEWFYQPPEDMTDKWSFLACPVGTRCVVYTNLGKTYAIRKNGRSFIRFQSMLPGGNSTTSCHTTVMLDCIYSKDTYYVLDVLHWGNQPMVDTEFDFRQFWIRSKFDELPLISKSSRTNFHPFLVLPAFPCSRDNLETAFSVHPYVGLGDVSFRVDGILFYHKEAHYIRGTSPLVLWLKVFMLTDMLQVPVACEYFNERPDDYTNSLDYMNKFDEEFSKRKHTKKSPSAMDVSVEVDDDNMSEDVNVESDDDSPEARLKKLSQVEMEG